MRRPWYIMREPKIADGELPKLSNSAHPGELKVQDAEELGKPVIWCPPPTIAKYYLRVVASWWAAVSFVFLCWLSGNSGISGPVMLFATQGVEDKIVGSIVMAILLPPMFAVGVWRNAFTIALSIVAFVCWLGFGLWLEALASV